MGIPRVNRPPPNRRSFQQKHFSAVLLHPCQRIVRQILLQAQRTHARSKARWKFPSGKAVPSISPLPWLPSGGLRACPSSSIRSARRIRKSSSARISAADISPDLFCWCGKILPLLVAVNASPLTGIGSWPVPAETRILYTDISSVIYSWIQLSA